jgi:hypothetical protein
LPDYVRAVEECEKILCGLKFLESKNVFQSLNDGGQTKRKFKPA